MRQKAFGLRLKILIAYLLPLTVVILLFAMSFDLVERDLIRFLILSLGSLIAVAVCASYLSSILTRPIRIITEGIDDFKDLKHRRIEVRSSDEFSYLAESVNSLAEHITPALIVKEHLLLAKEVQKKFLNLDPLPTGENRKLTTGHSDRGNIEFFGYYEGAAAVSGDYFNYRQLDENHYICILSDVAGKGYSAALLSIIVATLFENYCNNYDRNDDVYRNRIIEDINNIISQSGFLGRFIAVQILVINIKTGKTWICNAGDDIIHYYNSDKNSLKRIELSRTPAVGPFPSELIEMQGGFKQDSFSFSINDILFLCTDGIEESQRELRNADANSIKCEGCDFSYHEEDESRESDTHIIKSEFEEFGMFRMKSILSSIIQGDTYSLIKAHNPFPDKSLTFDFSDCKDSVRSAVLGLMSVERIFRLYPDSHAGPDDKIMIEREIDDFLKLHFNQYDEYFKYPVDHPDLSEYIYYTHLKETKQYDDFAILAIKLKMGSLATESDDFDELEELGTAVVVEELEELEELGITVEVEELEEIDDLDELEELYEPGVPIEVEELEDPE